MYLFNIGLIYIEKNDLKNAEKHLKIYIETNANFAQCQICYGRVLMTKGDYNNAIIHLTKDVKLDPHRNDSSWI